MSGFGAYAHNYDIKLFQRPFYRKEGGQDPIKTFVQTSGMQYLKNAERIRDMRFARSNEYNPDVAIRAEREDLLSKTFYENKANTDLAGLRGRLGLQLSRTGGSLSKKENKVTGSVEPTAGSSSVSPQTTKIAGGGKTNHTEYSSDKPIAKCVPTNSQDAGEIAVTRWVVCWKRCWLLILLTPNRWAFFIRGFADTWFA